MDLQGKIGNQLFQIVVLPLEVFNLLTSGVLDRASRETRSPLFDEFLGLGIEHPRLEPLAPTKVTDVICQGKLSKTMRILSSGAYFLRVLVRTCRLNVLVFWVKVSATCA